MTDKKLIRKLRYCQEANACLSCKAFPDCSGIEGLLGEITDRLEALLAENERLKADVAPVRRGHWIDCEDEYSSYVRCSECGDEYTSYEADCAHTDFCPGCGARMDLGCVDNA